MQLADLSGIAGYCLIAIEKLRMILGILDASNGVGTGRNLHFTLLYAIVYGTLKKFMKL